MTGQDEYRPTELRVMAEHGNIYPVWDNDIDHMGPVELPELGVDEKLCRGLKAWNGEFGATLRTNFEFESPEAEAGWVARGLTLAWDLQNALPDVEITYAPQGGRSRPLR